MQFTRKASKNHCTFCGQLFRYSGAKLNHIRAKHGAQLESFSSQTEQLRVPVASGGKDIMPAESWPLPLEQSEDEDSIVGDESGALDTAQEACGGIPKPQTKLHPTAGQPLSEQAMATTTLPLVFNPHLLAETRWLPFGSEMEFNLARWFVRHQVSKTALDEFFNLDLTEGLLAQPSHFRSTYTLRQKLNLLHHELGPTSWCERPFQFTSDLPSTFFYRDPVACIRYLFRQRIFKDVISYAPTQEYNAGGERIYSELHTGDWWWEVQVRPLEV